MHVCASECVCLCVCVPMSVELKLPLLLSNTHKHAHTHPQASIQTQTHNQPKPKPNALLHSPYYPLSPAALTSFSKRQGFFVSQVDLTLSSRDMHARLEHNVASLARHYEHIVLHDGLVDESVFADHLSKSHGDNPPSTPSIKRSPIKVWGVAWRGRKRGL